MRTWRSRAREMSGNRRQPSRRGQVGQGQLGPSWLAWSLLNSCPGCPVAGSAVGSGVSPVIPGGHRSLASALGLSLWTPQAP